MRLYFLPAGRRIDRTHIGALRREVSPSAGAAREIRVPRQGRRRPPRVWLIEGRRSGPRERVRARALEAHSQEGTTDGLFPLDGLIVLIRRRIYSCFSANGSWPSVPSPSAPSSARSGSASSSDVHLTRRGCVLGAEGYARSRKAVGPSPVDAGHVGNPRQLRLIVVPRTRHKELALPETSIYECVYLVRVAMHGLGRFSKGGLKRLAANGECGPSSSRQWDDRAHDVPGGSGRHGSFVGAAPARGIPAQATSVRNATAVIVVASPLGWSLTQLQSQDGQSLLADVRPSPHHA